MSDTHTDGSRPQLQAGEMGRLDSWKKIAAHFNRDVKTVQRWEQREGMPVHRHVHDKQGSVYAFRSELDIWWQSRRGKLRAQAIGRPSPSRNPRLRTRRPYCRRRHQRPRQQLPPTHRQPASCA